MSATAQELEPIDKVSDGEARLYAARGVAARSSDAAHVDVAVSLSADPDNLEVLKDLVGDLSKARTKTATVLIEAIEKVASRYVSKALSDELAEMTASYRVMLRESLARGDDQALKAALNRARLQERILAATPMAGQAEACELLGLSGTNPSATMRRKERRGEFLRFSLDGKPVYPLLQFDVEERRVYPAIRKLLAAKPEGWSNFRVLHWLIRPHLDFEETPAAALAGDPDAVLAAFERECEPIVHG